MNFCGVDYEQQVQDTKLSDTSFRCGPCVKDEGTHLDAVFSEEGLDTVLLEGEAVDDDLSKNPLDVIEEQLAHDVEKADGDTCCEITAIPVVTIHESPPIRSSANSISSTSIPGTESSSLKRCLAKGQAAASPVLNPFAKSDWAEADNSRPTRSGLDDPFHLQDEIKRSASGSIDGLLKRMEAGFCVKLYRQSGKVYEDVLLYLDTRRNRLCLRGDQEEKKTEDVINYWQELPIARILRLEIDRKVMRAKNQLQSFSIVLDSGRSEGRSFYDFEANSPIEREIIVATLMVVLEQAHSNYGRDEISEEPDRYAVEAPVVDLGTLDQPIACSPSLEENLLVEGQYTPRRTTRLHGGQFGDTEASLVINLEHLDDSAVLTPRLDELRRRTLSQNDLHGGPAPPGSIDDLLLSECKTSNQIASAWCADDICTLALKDIADSCAGIFVLKQAEAGMCTISGVTEEQRLMIEEYIASALGAPSAVLSYLSDAEVWNAQGVEPVENSSQNKPLEGRIRNRASVLNAQCDRLRNLRQEMTFVAALKASKDRMTLQTTQSFDDATMLKDKSLEKEVSDRFHSSALLKHVVGNMMLNTSKGQDGGEVEYYDSDPEDARPRARKDPRQVAAQSRRGMKSLQEKQVRALSGPGFEKIKASNKRVSRKLDEETIVQIVQQMTNERLTLIWHPTQKKGEPNRSPACIKLWIESGVCLIDGTFILPKLSWAKYESQTASGRRIEHTEPHKMDLLDICRIHIADTVDRRHHPFAVARRSFLIETQSEAFMFETQTPEECDRIVFGMKLVIARLASLLMLRDGRAAEEFFGAIAAGVPGEAPEWTRGNQPESDTMSVAK